MMRKKQSMLTVLLLGVFLFGFAVWGILKPADAQSQSERRNLAQFPAFSLSSFADDKWTSAFESCTLDQFPLREQFRTLKSLVSLGVFRQKDNHGVYFADGVVAKLEYPMNEESLAHAQERFGFVYDRYRSFRTKTIFWHHRTAIRRSITTRSSPRCKPLSRGRAGLT